MQTVEISLKEILVYVLRKWWKILAFALIMAGIFAGYAALTRDYDGALLEYERKLSTKQQELSVSNAELVAAKTYQENSILMKLDPYNKQRAQLSFSVKIPNEAFNGNLSAIEAADLSNLKIKAAEDVVDYYLLLAGNAPLMDVFAQAMPEPYGETYLREITSVESSAKGIITISTIGSDAAMAEAFAQAMYDYLANNSSQVTDAVGKHSLSPLKMSVHSMVDAELATSQLAQQSLVTEKIKLVEQKQTELEKLEKERPRNTLLSINSVVTGVLVGLVVGVLVAAFTYLTKLPIQIPEQIQTQLGIRYLGGIIRKKSLSQGDKLAGTLRMATEKEALEMLSASLREFAGDSKKILVTGTIAKGCIKEFSDKLVSFYGVSDVSFTVGGNVNTDAAAIDALAASDAVILVERMQVSRLKQVNQEKQRIDMSGKQILGYILY